LIEELRDAAPASLVMHGSSGTGDEKLAKAAKCGISKFNVAGDFFMASTKSYSEFWANNGKELKGCVSALESGYKKRVADYMKFLDSANRF
jgi:fructose-bisphosphate aldolase class II